MGIKTDNYRTSYSKKITQMVAGRGRRLLDSRRLGPGKAGSPCPRKTAKARAERKRKKAHKRKRGRR